MTARRFIIAGLLASFFGCQPASAAVIGVVAPRSGPYASLGAQVFQGARAAAEASGDTVIEIDESCDENGGALAARGLADAKATAAIGFLCVETLSTALPALKAAHIPAVTVSVRSKILMEDTLRNGWPFFRMAPAEGDEAEKLSETILSIWKAEPIALVEDGTIYGRELASAIRQHLEPMGMTPIFTDTFRPGQEQQVALVRRLAKAGATHVFVGGDRNDMAIIARDGASENISLVLLGGDAMRAANRPVPLRDGVLAVALPDYAALPSATAAVAALRAKNIDPDGYMLPAYAAVELIHQSATAAAGRPLATVIGGGSFSTALGTIRFDKNHELIDNPFRLLEWRGSSFVLSRPVTE
ncbi:branched-chain amino acid ABC transporter substrate-binding protein [Rhizobium terrae]|uniref:branched-chain amino acid ABC transporter substrate-binding protein n=1 Tax=Rhizobium terrae TaxID=2171756 RepID=UPI000E3D4719|nr:branched-chain amino acid ABC transporter substrate-binding protein [Rhizobium terrae]